MTLSLAVIDAAHSPGHDRIVCRRRDLHLTIVPLTAFHAYRTFGLPRHHNDPFDRLLIATALKEDVPRVATDREFKKYRGLRVIW
ncbi:MAG: hypothetical protein JO061_16365 [Acidobacteriaceae bacterium]|nr:hypothetical protein [Acidobacteriaceae bacterium]